MIFVKNMNSVSDQDWTTSEKYPGVRWKFLIDEDYNDSKGLSCGHKKDLCCHCNLHQLKTSI